MDGLTLFETQEEPQPHSWLTPIWIDSHLRVSPTLPSMYSYVRGQAETPVSIIQHLYSEIYVHPIILQDLLSLLHLIFSVVKFIETLPGPLVSPRLGSNSCYPLFLLFLQVLPPRSSNILMLIYVVPLFQIHKYQLFPSNFSHILN